MAKELIDYIKTFRNVFNDIPAVTYTSFPKYELIIFFDLTSIDANIKQIIADISEASRYARNTPFKLKLFSCRPGELYTEEKWDVDPYPCNGSPLATSTSRNASFLVTDLIEEKYIKESKIFIVSYNSIFKYLETFLRGHGVFWSFTAPYKNMNASFYYTLWEPMLNGLAKYSGCFSDDEVKNKVNALCNIKIPNILYSVDKIKFYNLQNKLVGKVGDENIKMFHLLPFMRELSYYVGNFYILVWGALDLIAWTMVYFYKLKIDKNGVGLHKDSFLDLIKVKNSKIHEILTSKEFKEWYKHVSDIRHFQAHRGDVYLSPMFRGQMYMPTEEDFNKEFLNNNHWKMILQSSNDAIINRTKESLKLFLAYRKSNLMSDEVTVVIDYKNGKPILSAYSLLEAVDWNTQNLLKYLKTIFDELLPNTQVLNHTEKN